MSPQTEVVTRALVRDVVVPVPGHDPVRVALVTLDNGQDHRRPTTFGPAGLAAIESTFVALAERDDLDAVAVTGKPFVFAVGADLTLLGGLASAGDVAAIGALGHRVLGRLGELDVPTFAFVNGAAMGGGLELALHCDHRTVSTAVDGRRSGLSLPEVSLGIIPGWGGAWLLPHLVGPENAVTVIVENPLDRNKQLDAATAVRLGVADVAFEPADFLMRSLRWAADVVRGRVLPERPEVRRDAGAWARAVGRGRAVADARTHGSAPAPYRALDLVEAARESTRAEGFVAEDAALADLVTSPEARASLYAFDLVQRRARKPAGAPDPSLARAVTKVGVVGAGLMAGQLALLAAGRMGVPVVMLDQDPDRTAAGVAAVHREVGRLAERGTFSADKANRVRALVTAGASWADYADCDLVVEAVYEELATKLAVVAELEKVVREDCVIATNTSALSVGAIADGCDHPERVLGLHFFNPVAVMPLVEVVRTTRTDDATLATGFAVVKAAGKSAVPCADARGFVVNRLLNAFIGSATSAVDDGTPPQGVEDAILSLGVPMGPFQLVELVGPQVALHVARTMADAYPGRSSVSPTLTAIVERGDRTLTTRTDTGAVLVVPEVAAALARPGTPLTALGVRERALDALAAEVVAMLDEAVVDDVRDIDLALLLGAGWPLHLGGVTPLLDRTGASERVAGRRLSPV